MLLNIEHTTVYRYAQPVQLGLHNLILRPREGHDVQIRSSSLMIQPAYRIRWVYDGFDNSVALVEFNEPASELRIESRLVVEQFNTNPFDFVLEPGAVELPFRYRDQDYADVSPYVTCQHPEEQEAVRNWVRPFLNAKGRARTQDFLTTLNRSVPLYFSYKRREEPGVQTPAQTLGLRSGSCRDFAFLFMEAARSLGLAARFVSGYLCQTEAGQYQAISGATHAWAEVFLPGAGWRGFDPTCGILAADSHVRVAVARKPSQALPISGSFVGLTSAYLGLEVQVFAHADS